MDAPTPACAQDLRVLLACPQCGASGEWSLLQTLRRCPYCTSVLWWPNDPARRECFRVPDTAPRPEDCLDVLQRTDAIRWLARLQGMSETDPSGDGLFMGRALADALAPELDALKRSRARLFNLRDVRTIHVPYLMVYALLAYHALGRTRGGAERKAFRPFLFSMDAVLPAYPEPWNFRDRGLWFSRQVLVPLDDAALASGDYLNPREMDTGAEDQARPWLGRRQLLEPDLDPIAFSARVVRAHGWWIFRPFHCVQADTPMGSGWFLVDGQFRTLAGHLDDGEAARVLARDWEPLGLERFRKPQVRPFPCRCPVCAGTLALDEQGAQQVCPTCGRLLEPSSKGFLPVPYRMLERDSIPWRRAAAGASGTAWVPFWRLTGRWRLGTGAYPTPESMASSVLPSLPQPHSRPSTSPLPLYFPAFDGWLYDRYDQWCLRTAAALGASGAEPVERRFHLFEKVGPEDLLIPPSQDSALYESQLDGLAPSFLPVPLQARLNAAWVKRLAEARFEAETRELVFVPIPYGRHGELPDRLLGPEGAVDATPLATGNFPPVLYRNVRRWKDRARSADDRRTSTRPPDSGGGL